MSKASRFGFLLGLLAGTAAVGAIGIMTGQGNATTPAVTKSGEHLVTTQSPDGLIIYLWRVSDTTGDIEFVARAVAPDQAPAGPTG